jgi:hypothetical protein
MFLKEVDGSGLSGKVYVDASIPLPFALPLRRKGGVRLVEPPLEDIFARFGFSLKDGGSVIPAYSQFAYLAPFFENFYDRGHGELNLWLRKHLNWLGAPMEKGGKHL